MNRELADAPRGDAAVEDNLALLEELDARLRAATEVGTSSPASVETALASWITSAFPGAAVRFVSPEPVASTATVHRSSATSLLLAVRGAAARWIHVTVPSSRGHRPGDLGRILALAARLFEGALARVHAPADVDPKGRAVSLAKRLVGRSGAMANLRRKVAQVASADSTVLILGESGVGKSHIARVLHDLSPRAKEPFLAVNCAALSSSLLDAELFGHERGAFTGAFETRPGLFEATGGGTLFLDEIGDAAPATQAKLLRAVEERAFTRLGSSKERAFRGRLLVATHRDLLASVAEGRFRGDLYYRVSAVKLTVPPLRERLEDVEDLATEILATLLPRSARDVRGLTPGAVARMRRYSWPGNLRELRNVLEHALVYGTSKRIEAEDLPLLDEAAPISVRMDTQMVSLPARSGDLELANLKAALRVARGNRRAAAKLLGLSRATVLRRIAEFGLEREGLGPSWSQPATSAVDAHAEGLNLQPRALEEASQSVTPLADR